MPTSHLMSAIVKKPENRRRKGRGNKEVARVRGGAYIEGNVSVTRGLLLPKPTLPLPQMLIPYDYLEEDTDGERQT